MAQNRIIAILGFPETGKTTYLAALYAASQSGDSPSIRITRLPDDSRYLDSAVEYLEALKPMPHTPAGGFQAIDLDVSIAGHDGEYTLRLPDVSGEEFDSQWEERLASEEVLELYSKANALMLFIYTKVQPTPWIQDVHEIVGTRPPTDEPDVSPPYSVAAAPTGVKIVEILQQALQVRPEGTAVRIAVVASAWDLELNVGAEARTPARWLREDLPLLWQFLEANSERLVYCVFGVSAQGDDYSGDISELERLAPCQRAIVVCGDDKGNDITLPLRWALGI